MGILDTTSTIVPILTDGRGHGFLESCASVGPEAQLRLGQSGIHPDQ